MLRFDDINWTNFQKHRPERKGYYYIKYKSKNNIVLSTAQYTGKFFVDVLTMRNLTKNVLEWYDKDKKVYINPKRLEQLRNKFEIHSEKDLNKAVSECVYKYLRVCKAV